MEHRPSPTVEKAPSAFLRTPTELLIKCSVWGRRQRLQKHDEQIGYLVYIWYLVFIFYLSACCILPFSFFLYYDSKTHLTFGCILLFFFFLFNFVYLFAWYFCVYVLLYFCLLDSVIIIIIISLYISILFYCFGIFCILFIVTFLSESHYILREFQLKTWGHLDHYVVDNMNDSSLKRCDFIILFMGRSF